MSGPPPPPSSVPVLKIKQAIDGPSTTNELALKMAERTKKREGSSRYIVSKTKINNTKVVWQLQRYISRQDLWAKR
jgi:hypothetical protein